MIIITITSTITTILLHYIVLYCISNYRLIIINNWETPVGGLRKAAHVAGGFDGNR